MAAPLTDARLAEITTRLGGLHRCDSGGDCGSDACKVLDTDAPDLLAEAQRLREAHASLAAAFDGVCGERDQARTEEQHVRELLTRYVDDEPCSLDHHGYCQNHGLSGLPCRNAEARRLLGMDAPGDDATGATL